MNARSWVCRLRGGLMLVPLAWTLVSLAQGPSWKFVVFGDSLSLVSENGINTNTLGEVASAIVKEAPAFVLFTGDCAAWPSSASLSLWTNVMGAVYGAGIPVFPGVGNHDAADPAAFTNFFGSMVPHNGPAGEEGTTYMVAYSNAVILVLNEYVPGNEYRINQNWVEALLATNTRPHVIAAGHAPAFKLFHGDCLGMYPANRDGFWNCLSNAHCRLYLCGHDHFYDHCRLDDGDGNPNNDLHQIIIGTGGAPLVVDGVYDGTNGLWSPMRIYHDAQYGYLTVTVTGNAVRTSWHQRTGLDTFVAGADDFAYSVTPPPMLDWSYSAGRLLLNWTAGGRLQSAPDSGGPFSDVAGASSPYALEELSGEGRFFRLVTE